MSKITKKIEKVLDEVEKATVPESFFLYGSRARGDHCEDSDYEVGVIYKLKNRDKGYEQNLRKINNVPYLNIFPFVYEDLIGYKIDTPFPKAIYLRELAESAVTLRGKKIIEKLEKPEINTVDLVEAASYEVAYGLAAHLSYRRDELKTASHEFVKSALFGCRVLILNDLEKFPVKYEEIGKLSKNLDLDPRFKDLIEYALQVRCNGALEEDKLYLNVKFLNKVVLERVKLELNGKARVVLPGNSIS